MQDLSASFWVLNVLGWGWGYFLLLLEKMSISVFFFLIHFLFIEKLKKKRTA
jgi:hypothetical protein